MHADAPAPAHFGIAAARGSSTRGRISGGRGLLIARAREEDVVIVPDEPRGLRSEAKDGVVQLARTTGMPLVAFGAAAWLVRRPRSRDRLQIPMPFSRVALVAMPVSVPGRNQPEPGDLHVRLAESLPRVTAEAEAAVAVPG